MGETMKKKRNMFGNYIEFAQFVMDDSKVLDQCVEKMARNLVEAVQISGYEPVSNLDFALCDPRDGDPLSYSGQVAAKLYAETRHDPNGLMFHMMMEVSNALQENCRLGYENKHLRARMEKSGIDPDQALDEDGDSV